MFSPHRYHHHHNHHHQIKMLCTGSSTITALAAYLEKMKIIWYKQKHILRGQVPRGTQRQFLENICSEDDLRSRIFGTFLLGFSNI